MKFTKLVIGCGLLGLLATAGILAADQIDAPIESGTADKVIADLQSILAAHQAYVADNGKVLPITSNTKITYGYLKIDDLVENSG